MELLKQISDKLNYYILSIKYSNLKRCISYRYCIQLNTKDDGMKIIELPYYTTENKSKITQRFMYKDNIKVGDITIPFSKIISLDFRTIDYKYRYYFGYNEISDGPINGLHSELEKYYVYSNEYKCAN